MNLPAEPVRQKLPAPAKSGPEREAALQIVRVLREAGHSAYFAGGCVRDNLLGVDPVDYDVATDATPDVVRRLFRGAKAVGESFGVVLVRRGEVVTEVATFRREWGYTDSRHPDNVEFADEAADAFRRDFTINALFEDPLSGEVIDYVGGLSDLQKKLIRAVGDPFNRLEEDHLRALRAVRFAARLSFEIEQRTVNAIRLSARYLRGISRERIGEEMRLLLTGANRSRGVKLLQELTLDAPVLREPSKQAEPAILSALPRDVSYPLALVAWVCDRRPGWRTERLAVEAPILTRELRSALMLKNRDTATVRSLLRKLTIVENNWPELTLAERKRLAAEPYFPDLLLLLKARKPEVSQKVENEVNQFRSEGLTPEPFLDGNDLARMGLKPGPIFGKLLNEVYDAQLEGDIRNRTDAEAFIRNRLQQLSNNDEGR